MTINEIKIKYINDKRNITVSCQTALRERLKETNLDGIVRRKKDGKLGYLDIYGVDVAFYPITKKGIRSQNSSGWSIDIENDYEPFKEENDKEKTV